GSLLPAVVIGWGLAVLLRRAGVGVAGSLVLHLIAGLVLVTVQFAPGTHLLGVPTPDTARSLARAVESSFAEFSELVAPVPARDGFLVVVAAGLWVFAYFLDTAAARFRGNVQGAVPHTAVFVTVGVLDRSSGRGRGAVDRRRPPPRGPRLHRPGGGRHRGRAGRGRRRGTVRPHLRTAGRPALAGPWRRAAHRGQPVRRAPFAAGPAQRRGRVHR